MRHAVLTLKMTRLGGVSLLVQTQQQREAAFTCTYTDTKGSAQTHTDTDIDTDIDIDRQTDRQTDRRTHTHTFFSTTASSGLVLFDLVVFLFFFSPF